MAKTLNTYLNAITGSVLVATRVAWRRLSPVQVLALNATAAAHTGTANETVLATIAIPAGTILAGDMLELGSLWSLTNNADTKTFRWRLGGTGTNGDLVFNSTITTQVVYQTFNKLYFPTTASQVGINASSQSGVGPSTSANFTAAVDMTVAQNLYLTVTNSNAAGTINRLAYDVRLSRSPV